MAHENPNGEEETPVKKELPKPALPNVKKPPVKRPPPTVRRGPPQIPTKAPETQSAIEPSAGETQLKEEACEKGESSFPSAPIMHDDSIGVEKI